MNTLALDNFPTPACTMNSEGLILSGNSLFHSMCELKESEKNSMLELLSPESVRDIFLCESTNTLLLQTRSGKKHEAFVSRLQSGSGETYFVSFLSKEQKSARQSLLSALTHDLRNPISNLSSLLSNEHRIQNSKHAIKVCCLELEESVNNYRFVHGKQTPLAETKLPLAEALEELCDRTLPPSIEVVSSPTEEILLSHETAFRFTRILELIIASVSFLDPMNPSVQTTLSVRSLAVDTESTSLTAELSLPGFSKDPKQLERLSFPSQGPKKNLNIHQQTLQILCQQLSATISIETDYEATDGRGVKITLACSIP